MTGFLCAYIPACVIMLVLYGWKGVVGLTVCAIIGNAIWNSVVSSWLDRVHDLFDFAAKHADD